MTWQPIATAPKNPPGIANGPWILAWSEWDFVTYQVRWVADIDGGNWTYAREALGLPNGRFTHWMPLPESPE